MLLRGYGIFPDQLCPRSAWGWGYFKVDDFAVDDDFLLHEVGADCGLVGLQEFLIDVAEWDGGYALRREVLPTLCYFISTPNRRE